MRFTTLLSNAGISPLSCHGDVEITKVCSDSRQCDTGSCFVAVRGHTNNGHDFISSIGTSAGAIICEDPTGIPEMVPFAVVEDSRAALGPVAQAMLDICMLPPHVVIEEVTPNTLIGSAV